MNHNVKQKEHKVIQEESEEDSEWEGRSYEGNLETEYDDELQKDSWDDDTLMNNLQRTTSSKKKGYALLKRGDKHTTSNVHNRSKGRKKAKVANVLERSLVSKSKNNARDTNLDVVERTKVYSRLPTKHHKGHLPHQPTKPIRDKGKDITSIIGQQSLKNHGLPELRGASGNVNKQYKSAALVVAATLTTQGTSLATTLPANTSINHVARVNEPNVAPCNRKLVRPTRPNFNLITSPGLLSEPQNLLKAQNSEIPLIKTDFSQPYSLDIDGALNTSTDGIIEHQLTDKKNLTLDGDNFEPDVTRDINRIVVALWRGPHINWNQVPNAIKDMWWAHFANTFTWEPHLENGINKLFKKKASAKIRNFVSRAKLQQKKPSHVTIEDWELMKTKFKETKYIEKCQKVQALRKKNFEEGGATYCGGSINAHEHRKRLSLQNDRAPSVMEMFKRTHKNKKGDWSGKRAKELADAYTELQTEEKKLPEVERRTKKELWMKAVGGPINGRVLGLGCVRPQGQLLGSTSGTQMCLELSQQKRWIVEKDAKIEAQKQEIRALKEDVEQVKAQMQMMMQLVQKSTQIGTVEDHNSQPTI